MNNYRPGILFLIPLLIVSLLLSVGSIPASPEGDLNLEALLVWGTNDENSPNPAHKPVEPALDRKLSKSPYKWKHYFEVNRQRATIAPNASKKIAMSDKCSLEVKNVGDSRIEVKLYGEGKQVCRQVEALPPGDTLILGGDAKNDTAWLVILKRVSPK